MKKLSAVSTYFLVQGIYGFCFAGMAAVSAVFRVDVVELNPLQLVLVGTTLEAAYFLGEIPTGVVADAYSRKLSLVIGYLLIGVGFMVEGAFALLTTTLLAQIIWGVGATFLSGAESAWLADEIGEERLTSTMIRGGQIHRGAAIAGILVAMTLGSLNLGLVFFLSGFGIFSLGMLLIPLMPETAFNPTPAPNRNSWQKMGDIFREGFSVVRRDGMMRLILWIGVFFGLSSEGIDRLSEPHLIESFSLPAFGDFQPIVWLGAIGIAGMGLGIFFDEWLRQTVDENDQIQTLRIVRALQFGFVGCIIGFALAWNFAVGVITLMALRQFRRRGFALYHPWVNKQIPGRVRATVLSMLGQVDALGQMAGGPMVGAIAAAYGYSIGFGVIAALLLPAPILLHVAVNQRQK